MSGTPAALTTMLNQSPLGAEVIVIGGGHAGCEAALATSRLGADTVLFTINLDHIAQMSCNPAIGGIGKGQLVREIDALGGEMALNTDAACLQFRMLNRSKGAAVRSPRAQCDKQLYQQRMKRRLENQANLRIQQARIIAIITDGNRIKGVKTEFGEIWEAKCTILATGTFLQGKLHYGLKNIPGGRAGDPAAVQLAESLRNDLKLTLGRLKTGTPPRILGRTVNFSKMTEQPADSESYRFSFQERQQEQESKKCPGIPSSLSCYTTESTPATAAVVQENIKQSPLYNGRIEGIGARYCPSFEDKVFRFPNRERHQIHLEPEGYFTEEYYLNGVSTSLPPSVQWPLVRSLAGLEQAHISRYGYAIEYDFVLPHQLNLCLNLKNWPDLFLAGQINGTSGYEEAAGQGLIAGINAARRAAGDNRDFIIGRDQGYLGVMIDDLTSKEIMEPYRLFTSRAEHRLLLRQDNADRRLAPLGEAIGLLDPNVGEKTRELETEIKELKKKLIKSRYQGTTFWDLLHRPDYSYKRLPTPPPASPRAIEQIEIEARYEGYIQRELSRTEKLKQLENWKIPENFSYNSIRGLRTEARLKLAQFRPENLARAARIDGVTPAEIALLQVWLKR